MQKIAALLTPTLVFPILLAVGLLCFFAYYWSLLFPRFQEGSLNWISLRQRRDAPRAPMTFFAPCHPLTRKDALPLLLITAVYAFTAFFRLGSLVNPQSFYDFGSGQVQEITFSEDIYLTKCMYYTGLGTGDYRLEISPDGAVWYTLWTRTGEDGKASGYYWADASGYAPHYALSQHYDDLFKWKLVEPENPQLVRRIRITGRADRNLLELGELALYGQDGVLLSVQIQEEQGAPLFDEQDTIPERPSWYNSTYFDEIYHARTAYEHIRGVSPYEISHPPMGKLILGLGIRLFGMTPFGWRFMGTLLGMMMLPILYLFLKNLFGKTPAALCGTALFACGFMHLTQTRIATIDTYAVFFILLMYYFLYRYLSLPVDASFRQGAPWLFLSGLFWGIGAASKWTVLYGGAGMALLYFIGLFFRLRDWPQNSEQPGKGGWLVKTLSFSVVCFVLLPAVIYLLSYLPYAQAKGDLSLDGLFRTMWENQTYMLSYHQGVHDSHPYSSRWYQWLVDGRPILYYLDSTSVPGYKSAFGAFSNPAVCWGGLFAILAITIQIGIRRCGKALFILIAYLSQLVPWIFIGRTTFAYHYFPSLLFLVFALSYVFCDLLETQTVGGKRAVYAFTGTTAALYALFYPVLIGLSIPTWYSTYLLRWLPSWPF